MKGTCAFCKIEFVKPYRYKAHKCSREFAEEVAAEDPALLVGREVSCFWEEEKTWYSGTLASYDSRLGTYTVMYEDGDMEEGVQLPDNTVFVHNDKFAQQVPSKSAIKSSRSRADPPRPKPTPEVSGGAEGQRKRKARELETSGGEGVEGGGREGGRAQGGKAPQSASRPKPAGTPLPEIKSRGCGDGHARGGQCVIKQGKSWFRTAVSELIKSQTTAGGDYRYKKQNNDGSSGCWVPGWLGVHLDPKEPPRTKWSRAYKGHYSGMVWDRSRAVWQWVGEFATVEETARHVDAVSLAYCGYYEANTNFPLPQDLPPEPEVGCKDLPMKASQLLKLQHDVKGVVSGTSEEWQEWMSELKMVQVTPGKQEFVPMMAKRLKWLVQRLDVDVLHADFRGEKRKLLMDACDACVKVGNKNDHAERAEDCFQCTRRTGCSDKPLQGKAKGKVDSGGFTHLSTSLYALTALARDIVCLEAVEQLEKGGDEVGVVELAAHKRDEIFKRWKAKMMNTTVPEFTKWVPGMRRIAVPHMDIPAGLEVIVIGAGASGLKAASELENMGAKVTVVEARERIGGRIYTYMLGEGKSYQQPVDLGATFVCGTSLDPPMNPLFIFIRELGIDLVAKHRNGPDSTAWFDEDGSSINDYKRTRVVDNQALGILDKLLDMAEEVDENFSIKDGVDALMKTTQLDEADLKILNAVFADLYNATMDKLSLRGMVSEGYSGDHELVVGGYKQIANTLYEKGGPGKTPLKDVRLGTVVTKVEMPAEAGVHVHVRNASGEPSVLTAHAVICTLPIGVLQDALRLKSVEFEPELPPFKQCAINSLAMGTENRIAMLFPKVFWNDTAHFLRPVAGNYTFANNHALGVKNVLCAWIRPAAVDKLEAMTEEEAMADVEQVLRQMYPDTYVKPLAYTVTYWQKDVYSRGAYTYVPVGASKRDYDTMAKPVSGDTAQDEEDARDVRNGAHLAPLREKTRLYFAGEGTIKSDAYTVHGAYMSGRREANRVSKWWIEHSSSVLQKCPPSSSSAKAKKVFQEVQPTQPDKPASQISQSPLLVKEKVTAAVPQTCGRSAGVMSLPQLMHANGISRM